MIQHHATKAAATMLIVVSVLALMTVTSTAGPIAPDTDDFRSFVLEATNEELNQAKHSDYWDPDWIAFRKFVAEANTIELSHARQLFETGVFPEIDSLSIGRFVRLPSDVTPTPVSPVIRAGNC